jgi:hypothetical protein
MTASIYNLTTIFANLCELRNGAFLFAADAAEFAAWTGLRAQLVELQAAGVRTWLRGSFTVRTQGVIDLIDRVTLVAQQ